MSACSTDCRRTASRSLGVAARSWQMESRWKTMCEGKYEGFGFAVDWRRKDLGICLQEAKGNGAQW